MEKFWGGRHYEFCWEFLLMFFVCWEKGEIKNYYLACSLTCFHKALLGYNSGFVVHVDREEGTEKEKVGVFKVSVTPYSRINVTTVFASEQL